MGGGETIHGNREGGEIGREGTTPFRCGGLRFDCPKISPATNTLYFCFFSSLFTVEINAERARVGRQRRPAENYGPRENEVRRGISIMGPALLGPTTYTARRHNWKARRSDAGTETPCSQHCARNLRTRAFLTCRWFLTTFHTWGCRLIASISGNYGAHEVDHDVYELAEPTRKGEKSPKRLRQREFNFHAKRMRVVRFRACSEIYVSHNITSPMS